MPLEGTMVLKKRRHDGDLNEHDCIAETMNILRSGNTILMPFFIIQIVIIILREINWYMVKEIMTVSIIRFDLSFFRF
jgi:hypothetical protein